MSNATAPQPDPSPPDPSPANVGAGVPLERPVERPPGPGDERGLLRWAPLLVVVLAWVAHGAVRQAGWVLDDVRLVRDNALVASGPSAIPRIFSSESDVELESGRYGPVTRASFALEAPLWRSRSGRLPARGFHLTNLLLHGLCALLLWRLLLALFPRRPLLGLAAAVCFAVHPIHTGTVSALMGRSELLATFFGLLTVLAWRRFRPSRWAWCVVALLCWWLALLSSQIAIGVPLAVLLIEYLVPRPQGQRPPYRAYVGFLCVLLIYGFTWMGPASGGGDLPLPGMGERLLVGFEGLGRMLLLLVIPVGQQADFSDGAMAAGGPLVGGVGWAFAGVALLLSAISLVRAARGLGGVVSGAWLVMLALALPAMVALPAGATLGTGFAYFCAVPLFAVAGRLAEGLLAGRATATGLASGGMSFVRARAVLVGVFAVACLIGLTRHEARAWQDDEALHEHLLEQNPRHIGAMVRMARLQRLRADALRMEASQLPSSSSTREQLLLDRTEALGQGLIWARRAVSHELGSSSSVALREMGFLQLAMDQSASALRALESAQRMDPLLRGAPEEMLRSQSAARVAVAAELYHAIGRARESLGDPEGAADAYLMAAQLDPGRSGYRTRAGLSLCRVNRYAEGLDLLLEARRLAQDSTEGAALDAHIKSARDSAHRIARERLADGKVAQDTGRMREAATLYEQALEVDPTSIEAWIRAGWVRGDYFGNHVRANEYFARAQELLEAAGVPRSEKTWRRIAGYREMMVKQRREEDAEEERLGEEQRLRFEADRKKRGDGG